MTTQEPATIKTKRTSIKGKYNVYVNGDFFCFIQKCDILNEWFAYKNDDSDYICGGLTKKEVMVNVNLCLNLNETEDVYEGPIEIIEPKTDAEYIALLNNTKAFKGLDIESDFNHNTLIGMHLNSLLGNSTELRSDMFDTDKKILIMKRMEKNGIDIFKGPYCVGNITKAYYQFLLETEYVEF